jgi:hypothetical protein
MVIMRAKTAPQDQFEIFLSAHMPARGLRYSVSFVEKRVSRPCYVVQRTDRLLTDQIALGNHRSVIGFFR